MTRSPLRRSGYCSISCRNRHTYQLCGAKACANPKCESRFNSQSETKLHCSKRCELKALLDFSREATRAQNGHQTFPVQSDSERILTQGLS